MWYESQLLHSLRLNAHHSFEPKESVQLILLSPERHPSGSRQRKAEASNVRKGRKGQWNGSVSPRKVQQLIDDCSSRIGKGTKRSRASGGPIRLTIYGVKLGGKAWELSIRSRGCLSFSFPSGTRPIHRLSMTRRL